MSAELTDSELLDRLESVDLPNGAFRLVQERMHQAQFQTSQQFLTAYPELLSHRSGVLSRYYDVDAVMRSAVAQRLFLLPGNEQLVSAGTNR